MAATATFAGFDPYTLTGINIMTDRELGHGSYATVLELEYMGLKCAGKKIHEVLLEQGDASYTVRRFEEECRLLSQVHHPNIVQFLGVYFQQRVTAPILVMEFLPTNLTSCIEQYGILPKEISYSILHDVALGLCYLHGQTPPIIHRDLSANNVLLTPNMSAKISDLGVARILKLTPLQVSRMTGTPGTPAYMPPEVMKANPKYDTSIDVFSYGILMIHLFSGKWPEPQDGQTRFEDGKLVPVTEAERRELFVRAIGNDHPLMDLILKCINNNAQTRGHTSEFVQRLADMVLQFPASFANRLEMLRQIKQQEEENQTKEEQIQQLTKEAKRNGSEVNRLKMNHTIETEQLRLKVEDLKSQKQQLKAESEAELEELKSNAATYEAQIDKERRQYKVQLAMERERLAKEKEHFETQKQKDKELYEAQLVKERGQYEVQLTMEREQLAQEREVNEKLVGDVHDLQSDLSKSISENNTLQSMNSKLETDILAKDSIILMKDASMKRKEDEIEAKSKALQQKETTMSELTDQLSKVREYLTTKQQVVQANINWKQCAGLPTKLNLGKATVINGKVYYGGGVADDHDDDKYIVSCYDPSQDIWTTLPPLPVRYFGLGQVNRKLVAVGGRKKSNGSSSNEIFTYDERSRKWKKNAPAMPTARLFPGVLSLQSALIVAGGYNTSLRTYVDTVEILTTDTSQWYKTDPLPTACQNTSLVVISSTCYALGGYRDPLHFSQALYASVDDLCNSVHVLANQIIHSGSRADTQSAWKTLPNTPTYGPATAVLGGNLLAIGGREITKGGATKKEVYMFSPSTESWIYISDLPEPQCEPTVVTVAVLSSTEILVLGGWCDGAHGENTVYKGTLTLTF